MTRYGVRREPGQWAAMLVAALFVVAGVLDMAPGLLDNLVHLAFGAVGFGLAGSARGAHGYLIGGGVVYVLLWQFGSVADPAIVPFHSDDVLVHVSLVISMIGMAMLSGGRRRTEVHVVPEVEYRLPTRYVRQRVVPSRPPGRADRRTPKQVGDVPKPLAVLACRV
ncbi:DUF4383 domain-containing protein [Actinophytocola oryzae]|nr:DUF4383 domain-containing protein [Actinophytocola oryzae]